MHLYLTPFSIVYIVSGAIGFVVSALALPHYLFTFRAGQRISSTLDRNRARLINMGILITESIRFSVHLLTIFVGTQSLLLPTTPEVPHPSFFRQFFGLEVIAFLLWANVGTTINSSIVYVQYRLLRDKRPFGSSRLGKFVARKLLSLIGRKSRGERGKELAAKGGGKDVEGNS